MQRRRIGPRTGWGLMAAGLWLLMASQTQAVESNGPYYAPPSWAQKLPAATRFVVLTDWGGQAVLDRETGLVWERSPSTTTHSWVNARWQCANRTIGGRMGWRLPSVHELASLIDPTQSNSNPPRRNLLLPLGHPFTNIMPEPYWSASAFSGTPDSAWAIFFSRLYEISGNGQVYTSGTPAEHALYVWCVRGGMTADAY